MFKLIIHGGAGAIKSPDEYKPSLQKIVTEGQELLQKGKSATEVVAHCVSLLEDDPLFNAGRGSVLTADERVECDASIMDGENLQAGAVAGVSGVKNPVKLAQTVMEKSEFVFLIGKGAEEFAKLHDLEFMPDEYFITDSRLKQLKEARDAGKVVLDHSDLKNKKNDEKKLGTVGAVAMDSRGNLASATSTGGIVNKRFGRVGDSSIIGAGTYANNSLAAVSCTGYGEQFIRATMARVAAEFTKELSAKEAAEKAIEFLQKSVNGLGGLIMIDRFGNIAHAYNTPGLLYAQADEKNIKVF